MYETYKKNKTQKFLFSEGYFAEVALARMQFKRCGIAFNR